LDRSLFRYVWRYSQRDQLAIFAVVILSLPFYYLSLDLPRQIVNDAIMGEAFRDGATTTTFLVVSFDLPALLGGGTVTLFPGLTVDQIGLLLGLSFLFLTFVFINGGFKYWINIAKGALGERMLRRLRFDLFATILRFTPDTLRVAKPSETATIIKDEVEPIGGFIGDAFVQPLLLASQAMTAMAFIMTQSVPLGLVVLAVVGVQFIVIPRLRRIQLRLGKERQLASRLLAGRIGEVVEGMDAVHGHGTARWEQTEIGERLYRLFDLRFRIFKWKFMVKFLNNFLSQLTPFFFYSVGGYFALTGRLDIGQLVAVIGAYRDLPPPLKELIDWDQQRLDVQIKYDQIIQQFMPDHLLPEEPAPSPAINGTHLAGPVSIEKLRVQDQNGAALADDISLSWGYPARVALVSGDSPVPHAIADVLARRILPVSGHITIAGQDFLRLPREVTGRRIACAGAQPRLFPGSLRQNLLYGLQHKLALAHGREQEGAPLAERVRIREALRTGNPLDSPFDDWLDHATIGMLSDKEIDEMLLENLALVGMGDDVFQFGVNGWVDTARYPALADKLVEARNHLRTRLADCGMSDLIETFDEERYANLASIGENLLFGASRNPLFNGRGRARNPLLLKVLEAEQLTGDLIGIGARIASTMMEIFSDLPPDHPLVSQFSFLASDEMSDFESALGRWTRRGLRGLGPDDRERLLAPSFDYIEPRHRLGLLDDAMRERLLRARRHVREEITRTDGRWDLEPYRRDAFCHNAVLRDNLLFGRVDMRIANARARVAKVVIDVVNDLDLRPAISAVGLDLDVGPGGRMLTRRQQTGVDLVRCIVKKPEIMIVDGAFSVFSNADCETILGKLIALFQNRCLVIITRDDAGLDAFDTVFAFENGAVITRRPDAHPGPQPPAA
jgi:putative ABC transport system ATP-binding protein